MTSVYIHPRFRGADKGEGGVRRAIEGQVDNLAAEGIEVLDAPDQAVVIACHITIPSDYLRRFAGKPIIAHNHGLHWSDVLGEDGKPWAANQNVDVMRLILVADIVTAPTEWVAQAIRRNTCRDVRVVPHGIDLEAWTPEAPDPSMYVLWNKNRIDPVCDPTAVTELAKRMPEVSFVSTFTIGPPPDNVTLRGKITHAEAMADVRLAGAYLATSRETFGVGTLEALAAGVPVVSWRFGGQEEIIAHLVDGYLAEFGDYDDLAEGVRWALRQREVHADAPADSPFRECAEEYPWSRAAAMYADIYREAAARYEDDRPKVSVIVPAYNMETYLEDTLKSVLGQDQSGFTDWECIVVDDDSPDRSGEIAEAFAAADPRFKVIHNEKNLYLAGARNVGLAQARGRYIMPLDADDMLAPGSLLVLSRALDGDRLAHVVYGNMLFVEEDGRTPTNYGYGRPGFSNWPMDFDFATQLTAPKSGRRPFNLLPYCSMMRREALEQTGGWRTRRRVAEDADLWCRLSSYGYTPKMVTKEPTVVYRNRPESMGRSVATDDWTTWYPWSRVPEIAPGGSNPERHVPSFDPPQVSVIIPVGPGHERLVLDAIDSLDAQTFREWECVVVWDSPKRLPLLPSWVRVLNYDYQEFLISSDEPAPPQPLGPARARNVGIAAARGELILPLDADDILQPNALKEMVAAYRDTGRVVYSDFYRDDKTPGIFYVYKTPEFDVKNVQKVMLGAVTQLTPRAWINEVGGYDETLPGWEDWALQIALCVAGYCFERVALPLWTYRKHTGTLREHFYTEGKAAARVGMMKKFPGLWPTDESNAGIVNRKGVTQMACRSCGGSGRTVAPPSLRSAPAPTAGGAKMIIYEGGREGEVTYNGSVTKTPYSFGKGVKRYVYDADAPHLLQFPGFRVIEGEVAAQAAEGAPPTADEAPVLIAPGTDGGDLHPTQAIPAEDLTARPTGVPVVHQLPPTTADADDVDGFEGQPTAPRRAAKAAEPKTEGAARAANLDDLEKKRGAAAKPKTAAAARVAAATKTK